MGPGRGAGRMMITPNAVRLTESEATEARGLAGGPAGFYSLLGAAAILADSMDRRRLGELFPGVINSLSVRPATRAGAGSESGPVVLGEGETVWIASDAYLRLRGATLAGGLGGGRDEG